MDIGQCRPISHFLFYKEDQSLQGAVSRPGGVVIIVWLDVFRQVDDFASFELLDTFEHNGLTMVVCALIMTSQANLLTYSLPLAV